MLQIDATSSRQLAAVILAINQAEREVQKQIRSAIKGSIGSAWQDSLAAKATTSLERAILVKPARVQVSNQGVKLTDGASTRALSGGASPAQLAKAVEFGANRDAYTDYTARSSRGNSYKVHRRSQRQFKSHSRSGWVAYPTANRELIGRYASLFVSTTIRTLHEIFEKGAR